MKRIFILLPFVLLLVILAGCGSSKKVEFQNVVLPFYGYSEYCNLKTLHVVSLERPKHVEFSFDDEELVILAKGLDGKYIISDFKYTTYAVLYVKYGISTHKLTVTKNKGFYYINGKKYASAKAVIDKILLLD